MLRLCILFIFTFNCYSIDIFQPLPEKITGIDLKKAKLGEELFFDPILSKHKDVSCFSCHFQYGADNKKVSIGTKGQKGLINSPSIFNLNYQIAFFWNGRATSLKEQMMGPLSMEHEMAMDKETIEKRLNNSNKYTMLFQEAFQKGPSFELVLDAIVEFEKTLITPNSKFDKFLKGEAKLSKKEQKGFELFNRYGCVSCHNGINLGGNSYQKFGTVLNYPFFEIKKDDRYTHTQKEKDTGVYKVAPLRNITKTAPYFHTGEIEDLKTAINVMALYNLGRSLNDEDLESIESFLNTLTGELPRSFLQRLKGDN